MDPMELLFFKMKNFASVCNRLEEMINGADDGDETATLKDALKLIKDQAETYIYPRTVSIHIWTLLTSYMRR